MKRSASAVWNGSIKEGSGNLSTASGVLRKTPNSFHTRIDEEHGTNPEELIAAAHASCFSMALPGLLTQAGFATPPFVTSVTVTLQKTGNDFRVTAVHLDVDARVPGISEERFNSVVNSAKDGCPISRLLKAEITMQARLTSPLTM